MKILRQGGDWWIGGLKIQFSDGRHHRLIFRQIKLHTTKPIFHNSLVRSVKVARVSVYYEEALKDKKYEKKVRKKNSFVFFFLFKSSFSERLYSRSHTKENI